MKIRDGRANAALIYALVVPCYNESDVLQTTISRLADLVEDLVLTYGCSEQSFVVLVDDGSEDDTWELITAAVEHHPKRVRGVRLAQNVGHQGALLCGLDYATERCDAAITIDADLQDDLTAIPTMISEFQKGAELVFGVRESREIDSWFKRTTAALFYKLMRWMGADIVENHADFRLMSARSLRNLRKFSEYNMFLRGLSPLLHRKIAIVTYRREQRSAGDTKYPLHKMLALAWNGITSFSVVPLRLISITSGVVFLVSGVMAMYAFVGVAFGNTLPGWASVVIPLYLLGGLLMLSIGVVGEYVGKVLLEVKRRPRFLIDTVLGDSTKDE